MNDWKDSEIVDIQYDLDNDTVLLRLKSGYVVMIKEGTVINNAVIELDGAIDWSFQVVSQYGNE